MDLSVLLTIHFWLKYYAHLVFLAVIFEAFLQIFHFNILGLFVGSFGMIVGSMLMQGARKNDVDWIVCYIFLGTFYNIVCAIITTIAWFNFQDVNFEKEGAQSTLIQYYCSFGNNAAICLSMLPVYFLYKEILKKFYKK